MKIIKKILIFIILFVIPTYTLADEFPTLHSNNVYLYNLDTDEVLYEKNSEEQTLVASLTKIMTSIVAIENIENLDESVILTKDIFDYLDSDLSIAGFKINETVTYRDLLYGSLLPSGADATHSLAVFLAGGEENFVNLMNEKAKELNLKNTHFANSIGIESDTNNHYSTVEDFSKILSYALKNETFKEIFTADDYKTSDGLLDLTSSKSKVEKNADIDLSIITGSKTGYTSKAGLCLASFSKKNASLLLITTGANKDDSKIGHFEDAKNLYEYYNSNYTYKTLANKNDEIAQIKTEYDQKISLLLPEKVIVYMNKSIKKSNLTFKYVGKKVLNKKVKKGDIIGKYKIFNGKNLIYEEDIISPIDVHFRLKTKYKLIIITLILFCLNLKIYEIFLRLKKRRRKTIEKNN